MIAQLRAQYVRLQQRRTGRDGYDHWFNAPINNAKLAAVAIYRELVPDFERLMAACDGDLARFYAAVAALGELEPNRRHAHLNSAHGCS